MGEKVSVIIPVYNAEKYLAECLDSALNQTYKNVEIVAVDDGSTDGSANVLESYAKAHANITVVRTENGGVSRARNTGLNAANGDFVTFLDSDDVLTVDAIEILMQDLKDNDADIAVGLTDGRVDRLQASSDGTAASVWKGTEALQQSLKDSPYTYSACAKLFKREALSGVTFAEGRRIHEDSYFVFCAFLKKPTVVARDVYVYRYRENENSASHAAFSEKYYDILYFAEEKIKAIETLYSELSDMAKNVLVKANIAMLQCFLNTVDKRYKKDIKNCIRTVRKHKKYFVPAYAGDKKRFKIIRFHLYGLYKFAYRLKYGKRIKKA